MPIYEYHCGKCGHEFEVLQKHFDVDEVPCERCGAPAKRMISNTTFVLKGSGWYVTDYKGANACTSGDGGKQHHADKPAAEASSCPSADKSSGCSSCPSAASGSSSSASTAS